MLKFKTISRYCPFVIEKKLFTNILVSLRVFTVPEFVSLINFKNNDNLNFT